MKTTIINSIYQNALRSFVTLYDIKPERFFWELIRTDIPYMGDDILSYVDEVVNNNYYESMYKMIITQCNVAKVDIDVIDAMIDTEDVEYASFDTFETFEELTKFYYTRCHKNYIYIVSKDYDAEDDTTYFTLSRLVKFDDK